MKTHGISVYREVFKKGVLAKVLADSTVKELKKSKKIDFDKDSHSEIRDVVSTTVHNHMNADQWTWTHTHHEHREGEITGRKRRV